MKHRFTTGRSHYLLDYSKTGPITHCWLFKEDKDDPTWNTEEATPITYGSAICSPRDRYIPLKGRKIAAGRAIRLAFPDSSDDFRELIWNQLLDE